MPTPFAPFVIAFLYYSPFCHHISFATPELLWKVLTAKRIGGEKWPVGWLNVI